MYWFTLIIPVISAHFLAKYLSKIANVSNQNFYGEAMAILVTIQYLSFFIGKII
ncbi:hypothetical protein GCM10007878_00790 [Marinospirillum insulare]|uniref:Uncharacterized protein n=1 Tax=Marinospirillum insulare TaxID=217169 RepID=A0ABQ5ZRP3_9GAMM|nr:hypothetical protein GCM10007878_00790 [Marinospirillum insulare]